MIDVSWGDQQVDARRRLDPCQRDASSAKTVYGDKASQFPVGGASLQATAHGSSRVRKIAGLAYVRSEFVIDNLYTLN
jgi:hypothetical protein